MKVGTFVALLATSCVVAQTGNDGNVTLLGDISITGATRTTAIASDQLTIDGSVSVTFQVSGESITATRGSIGNLVCKAIAGPKGSVHFSGEMVLGSSLEVNGTTRASSFIQNDVVQWALRHHDDFEGEVKGWDTDKTGSCDGFDKHLGGHCQQTGGSVKKTFTGLGKHTSVRVQAAYHFLDSWENEKAWAKVNGRTVWSDYNDIRGLHPNALNVCGGDHPEGKFAVPIDVVLAHTDDVIEVEFGADLDEHECDESFGIDDVTISVK